MGDTLKDADDSDWIFKGLYRMNAVAAMLKILIVKFI